MSAPATPLKPGPFSTSLSEIARLTRLDPKAAAKKAREFLCRYPGQRQALMLLVSAHRLAGDLSAARKALLEMAEAQPGVAAVQYELGLLLNEAGEGDKAVAALSRAVALEPDDAQAWRALGDALAASGNAAEANKAYAKRLEFAAARLARLEKAASGEQSGLPKAEQMLRGRLGRDPTDMAALILLGGLYMRLERYGDAEKPLRRAIELAPECLAARWKLAHVLVKGARWQEALAEMETLLSQAPDDPDYLGLKAHLLLHLGDYEASVANYEALLAKAPAPERWMLYGYALTTVGRRQDAVTAYREAIALRPGYGEAYWSLANLKTFRFTPEEIEAMREAAARDGATARNRLLIHFSLGKAFEDAKQYEPSFEHYKQGNALQRSQMGHNANDVDAFVRRTKALYTPEFFRRRAGSGIAAADPIFVVGLPRSGSTLIEQILSSHSTIEGTRELTALTAQAKRLADYDRARDSRYPEAVGEASREQLRAAGEAYIAQTRVHRKTDRPFFVDKMPMNFHHIGLLHLILPNAKIIDARRHPMGCGFANFKQYFPAGQSFAYDLADIGRFYRSYVEFMAHFDAVLPGKIHRVFYEDMVADPEGEIRKLLDYLGLPFEESCARFYETGRGVFTPSAEQVRQPIYAGAVELWRRYEAWLGPLRAALGDVLDLYPAVPDFRADSQARQTSWNLSGQFSARFQ